MPAFHNRLGRACGVILTAHLAMSSSLFLCSRFVHDRTFEEHWDCSTPTLRKRTHYFSFWKRAFYSPVLTSQERSCLDAWMSLLSLHSPHLTTSSLSPQAVLQDSLAILQGTGELRDGIYLLETLPFKGEPYLLELRREYQDDVVFLHGKTRTDVGLTIPFTSYVIPLLVFPASFTLQLERTAPNSRLHITSMEHRWFDGLICSYQTNSVSSPWGDLGDLCRRYNGFLWSTLVTKKISLGERRRALATRAAEIEGDLKERQEEQMEL